MNERTLEQSIKSLASNPVRTLLTTLGIIIGIATVIMVFSAGEGFRSLINDQLSSWGTNTLFIETRVPPTTKNLANNSPTSTDFRRATSSVQITSFKVSDLEEIKKLPNVTGAYGIATGLSVISYRNTAKSVVYYAAGAEMASIDKHTLKEGRFFTEAENKGANQVVILGNTLAKDLFGQDEALGKLVRIGNLNFQIIGVYDPQGSILTGGTDDSLYMPLTTAQKKMLGINYITVGVVQMMNENLSESTAEDIKQTLRRTHNIKDPSKDDFIVTTQEDALSTFNTIFNGITILLIGIASISLLVGGVGIMNIMYVTVTERTAEIGLKKAIGAKNSDILEEFLVESVLITIIGGFLGIILGSVLGWLVSLIAANFRLIWHFFVPFYAVVIAVGFSGAIGIFFGVFPARLASEMDPIEALRYE